METRSVPSFETDESKKGCRRLIVRMIRSPPCRIYPYPTEQFSEERRWPNCRGGRKGVDPSDLQTGKVEAGKQYFEGAGGCAVCHSPQGDLAGIASRLKGLELEEEMLYPKHAKSKVTVTADGRTITGTLAYQDEFTVAQWTNQARIAHGVFAMCNIKSMSR